MLNPVNNWSFFKMTFLILKSMQIEIIFALFLCVISAPISPALAKQIFPQILLSVLGISVSVFTAFRNTQAYNRWWEARTLWGGLVSQSRNLQNGLLALIPDDQNKKKDLHKLLGLQVVLVWTINHELRGSFHPVCAENLKNLRGSLGLENNIISSQDLMKKLSAEILKLNELGRIDGPGRLNLLMVQKDTSIALGGLERIREQPLPASYDLFIKAIVWIFGYLLFIRLDAMHDPIGGIVGFICMFGFIVAERLGAFIENPFISGIYGLPINRICATISSNLLSADHPLATPPQNKSALIWT